jgi:hypothetical protein
VTLDRDALRAGPALADAADEPPSIGEPRWPPVFALLLFMALHIAVHLWVPGTSPIRVVWLVPTVEGLFLVLLITAHPVGRGERRQVRRIGLALVGLMVVAALWATGILIRDLIHGTGPANSWPRQASSGSGTTWRSGSSTGCSTAAARCGACEAPRRSTSRSRSR